MNRCSTVLNWTVQNWQSRFFLSPPPPGRYNGLVIVQPHVEEGLSIFHTVDWVWQAFTSSCPFSLKTKPFTLMPVLQEISATRRSWNLMTEFTPPCENNGSWECKHVRFVLNNYWVSKGLSVAFVPQWVQPLRASLPSRLFDASSLHTAVQPIWFISCRCSKTSSPQFNNATL